ncbi:MAG: hypothetical protein RMY29_016745 [Nostoc sp. CreGUA01]
MGHGGATAVLGSPQVEQVASLGIGHGALKSHTFKSSLILNFEF